MTRPLAFVTVTVCVGVFVGTSLDAQPGRLSYMAGTLHVWPCRHLLALAALIGCECGDVITADAIGGFTSDGLEA